MCLSWAHATMANAWVSGRARLPGSQGFDLEIEGCHHLGGVSLALTEWRATSPYAATDPVADVVGRPARMTLGACQSDDTATYFPTLPGYALEQKRHEPHGQACRAAHADYSRRRRWTGNE